MEVLYLKHEMWLKDRFLASQTEWLWRRDFTSQIFIGHTREQEDKKRRRSLITWNCLTWGSNVDGKRDRWSLVPWFLDVCGYAYSETNVDLKLPKEEWRPAHESAIALCRVGLGNNRRCGCFLPNQIVVLRRRRTRSVELNTSLPKVTHNFYRQWGF